MNIVIISVKFAFCCPLRLCVIYVRALSRDSIVTVDGAQCSSLYSARKACLKFDHWRSRTRQPRKELRARALTHSVATYTYRTRVRRRRTAFKRTSGKSVPHAADPGSDWTLLRLSLSGDEEQNSQWCGFEKYASLEMIARE